MIYESEFPIELMPEPFSCDEFSRYGITVNNQQEQIKKHTHKNTHTHTLSMNRMAWKSFKALFIRRKSCVHWKLEIAIVQCSHSMNTKEDQRCFILCRISFVTSFFRGGGRAPGMIPTIGIEKKIMHSWEVMRQQRKRDEKWGTGESGFWKQNESIYCMSPSP